MLDEIENFDSVWCGFSSDFRELGISF